MRRDAKSRGQSRAQSRGGAIAMSQDNADTAAASEPQRRPAQPEWAGRLRELYRSVVEEPLPDSFADLLSALDQNPDA